MGRRLEVGRKRRSIGTQLDRTAVKNHVRMRGTQGTQEMASVTSGRGASASDVEYIFAKARTRSTKCPYCRRHYQHAAACENHVWAAHDDILLLRRQTTNFGLATSSMQTSFIENATANQPNTSAGDEFAECWGNSDYESDPAILCHNL